MISYYANLTATAFYYPVQHVMKQY